MKGITGADMNEGQLRNSPRLEEFLAELAVATYGVALRHGIKGSFIDLELELWQELRGVVGNGLLQQEAS